MAGKYVNASTTADGVFQSQSELISVSRGEIGFLPRRIMADSITGPVLMTNSVPDGDMGALSFKYRDSALQHYECGSCFRSLLPQISYDPMTWLKSGDKGTALLLQHDSAFSVGVWKPNKTSL